MPLRCLFIDMNAFFASVEQNDDPSLRGKPVAVVPTMAETTSCIAASYEAKAMGIKTGTPVWEARKLSQGRIIFRTGNHQRYVLVHNQIVDAVGSVLPIDRIASIDEMSCRLKGDEQRPARAAEMAKEIKAAIRARAGEWMACSIGVAPNWLLAKVATDMKKPDGLVVLSDDILPYALYGLKLQDFSGIGPRMLRRLNLHGVFTVRQLCEMSARALSEVWGSKVIGGRWYRYLRGEEVEDVQTHRRTVSHSHILPPALRTDEGAYGVLVKLTHKAAARMRKIGYWARTVSVAVNFQQPFNEPFSHREKSEAPPMSPPESGDPAWQSERLDEEEAKPRARRYPSHQRWGAWCHVPLCQDTPNILRAVTQLWRTRPGGKPFKVGMVLSDLRAARCATPSLFEEDRKAADLSHTMDEVNREFGASVIHFGSMHGMKEAAPSRIAFTQIPDFDLRVN